jgi:hypothetical protein
VAEKPGWMTYYPNSKLLAGIPATSDAGYTRIRINAYDGKALVEQKYYLNVILGTSSFNGNLPGIQPNLYPNPATDQVVIVYKDQKDTGIFSLYDQLGRVVTEEPLVPGQDASFSIAELNIPPGIYLYVIQHGADNNTGKLIIQSK